MFFFSPWPLKIKKPPPSQTPGLQKVSLNVQLVSMNVQTLNDEDYCAKRDFNTCSTTTSVRARWLRKQLKEHHVNIVGVQESRTRQATAVQDDGWYILAEPSTNGRGGIEAWIDLRMPYAFDANATPLYFEPQDFRICASSSQWMLLSIKATHLCAWVLIAHSPHQGAPLAEYQAFWEHLCQALDTFKVGMLFLLADANVTCGDQTCQAVHDHQPEPHNAYSQVFVDTLTCLGMFLPATSGLYHQGHGHTHTGLGGNRRRIDYVAIPAAMCHQATLASRVLYDVDVVRDLRDHQPVCVTMQWSATDSKTWRKQRLRVPYSIPTRPSPEQTHKMRCALAQLSMPTTDLPDLHHTSDVTQHALCLQHLVRTAAVHVYPLQAQPKKPHITDEIWAMLCRRKQLRQEVWSIERRHQCQHLRHILQHWRAFTRGTQMPQGCDRVRQHFLVARKLLQLHGLRKQIRMCLRAAKCATLEAFAEEVRQAEGRQGLAGVWRKIRSFMPKHATMQSKGLQTEELLQSATPHFAKLEGGDICSIDKIFNEYAHQQEVPVPDGITYQLLPSLLDLETGVNRLRNGKSPGEDLITADVLKNAAPEAAKALFPLALKAHVHAAQPLPFTGATLCAFYKGKGLRTSIDNYRSIMLASCFAKITQAWLRSRIDPVIKLRMHQLQLGGRKAQQTIYGTHVVRTFLTVARARKQSAATIFVDLEAAFYRMLRELAVGPCQTEVPLDELLERLQVPACYRPAVRHAASTAEQGILAELPACLKAYLLSWQRNTWFMHAETGDSASVRTGSRPGLPLADLIFNLAATGLLTEIQDAFEAEGITTAIHLPEGQPATVMPVVTWIDDMAICVTADNPEALNSRLPVAMRCVHTVFGRAAMRLNYLVGKTEAIVAYAGPGAALARQKLHIHANSTMSFTLAQAREEPLTLPLRVAPSYKHLGSWIDATGDMQREIKYRAGQAYEAMRCMRKGIFGCKGLSAAAKSQLYKATILTRLFFAAGAWPKLSRSAHRALLVCYHSTIRVALGCHHRGDFTDLTNDELLAKHQLPTCEVQLRQSRLLHYRHLVLTGPEILTQLLRNEDRAINGSWLCMLREDVCWMQHHVQGGTLALQLDFDWPQAAAFVISHQARWTSWVRKAVSAAIVQHAMIHNLQGWRKRLASEFATAGITGVMPSQALPIPAVCDFVCDQCSKAFPSSSQLGVHKHNVHNYVAIAARYCYATHCPVCLREYYSTAKLQAHLRKHCCLAWARANLIPLKDEELSRVPLPAWLVGFKHIKAPRLAGPRLPTLQERFDNDCLGPYHHMHCPEPIEPDSLPQVLEVASDVHHQPLPRVPGNEPDGGHEGDPAHAMPEHPWPTFAPVGLAAQQQDQAFDATRPGEHWMHNWPAHGIRLNKPTYYVLHLFSGHSRPQDIRWWAEQISTTAPYDLIVLCLDIVHHEVHGDLTRWSTITHIITLARQGRFVGGQAGPPCETWSAVRHNCLPNAPRPLRLRSQLWGLAGLKAREYRQLAIGNLLYQYTLWIMLTIALRGGGVCVEHPAIPRQATCASSWHLPQIRWFCLLQTAFLHTVRQGEWGQKSPKPTVFLVANLGTFATRLEETKVPPDLRPQPGASTEYPAALSKGLVLAFADQADVLRARSAPPPPSAAFLAFAAWAANFRPPTRRF